MAASVQIWPALGSFISSATDGLLKSLGLGGIVCIIAITVGNFFGNRWSFIEISGYTFLMFGLIARGLDMVEGGKRKVRTIPPSSSWKNRILKARRHTPDWRLRTGVV